MAIARMRAFEGHRITEAIRRGNRYPNGILLILNFNKINIPKFHFEFQIEHVNMSKGEDLPNSAHRKLQAKNVAFYGCLYRKMKSIGVLSDTQFLSFSQKNNKHLKNKYKRVLSKTKKAQKQVY